MSKPRSDNSFVLALFVPCLLGAPSAFDSFIPRHSTVIVANLLSVFLALVFGFALLKSGALTRLSQNGFGRAGQPKSSWVKSLCFLGIVGFVLLCSRSAFGNGIPWLITLAVGEPGSMQVTSTMIGMPLMKMRSCTRLSLAGIPDQMIGNRVMCGDRRIDIDVGTPLRVSGKSTLFGVQVVKIAPDKAIFL